MTARQWGQLVKACCCAVAPAYVTFVILLWRLP